MNREELLALLAERIFARRQPGKPLKVGIDGRSAAGKSVLAIELAWLLQARALQVLRPSVDGFHHPRERRYSKGEYSAAGYYEDAYNYPAVIEHLLGPLSGNVFPALCRQVSYDFRADVPEDSQPISVSADAVLLFEGLFLFRREINGYWDFRILIDVDPPTSLSRSLERDTGVLGPADTIRRKHELRYEPAWQIYLREEQPERKADVVIDNREFSQPRILVGQAGQR